ncbi:MAG: DUF6351 family protein [Pigmentiphaga sp.]|uniref:DUF6351 family protein n=1 Tax=Pigmentiphaga sp. TaxID=1977564 RepID=UPI0029AFBFEA|nr:DUF6351 family protein [Pigmentiphaga sp.]MDX3905084.1 DUF6351 family protein [Pigmentiphaga sp.]
MKKASFTLASAALGALMAGCGGGDGGSPGDGGPPPHASALQISVLGNRADLVSGGQALVEVEVPGESAPRFDQIRVMLNGKDVTDAFAQRANGRYLGLVEGLADGNNQLVARIAGGPSAHLSIKNHPIGGPIFSGPQVAYWECTTKVANPTPTNPDLGDHLDDKCNVAAPVFRYQYRTTDGRFAVYDPASPPPREQIATVTTDEGKAVPYIVRIERGVVNRGKYDIAYLANPEDPTRGWTPYERPASWNGKLHWKFGSGCEYGRTQANPGNVLDDVALSRGFMVASSEMTQYGSHCNDVTSAETVMMLKEHITENYGEIRFTMADGNSGGAHQQHLHASNYPGLLQGLLPGDGWQDTWTTGREFADCGLLKRFYDARKAAGAPFTIMEKAHINGHVYDQVCEGPANTNMASRTPFYLDPTVGGAGCGTHWNVWSVGNPTGIRCTLQDFNIAVFGPRDQTGYAKTPIDNVGILYGFNAVNSGRISPEQFVMLNEQVGGYDINGQWQPARMAADPGAAEIAHQSGRVPHGRPLGEVAIIQSILFNVIEEHYDFRGYVIRNRILREHGDYGNHVIWRYKSMPPDYAARRFDAMNEWLTKVEADKSAKPLREKIIANKPAVAVDSCWRADVGQWSTDPDYCNTGADPTSASTVSGSGETAVYSPGVDEWPVFRDTRVAAGEGLASDIMKCQLKPLSRADFDVAFSGEQWARLQAVFPGGVCDYSKPGVGQTPPEPWQSFMEGPGGKPLGPAPTSARGEGT